MSCVYQLSNKENNNDDDDDDQQDYEFMTRQNNSICEVIWLIQRSYFKNTLPGRSLDPAGFVCPTYFLVHAGWAPVKWSHNNRLLFELIGAGCNVDWHVSRVSCAVQTASSHYRESFRRNDHLATRLCPAIFCVTLMSPHHAGSQMPFIFH